MAVYFISDLHLFHKHVTLFADAKHRAWTTAEDHDEDLIARINSVVHKRDKLFILGDVVFKRGCASILDSIKCANIHIILGNHCTEYNSARDLLQYCEKVDGITKYKRFWLTHAPIHPCELRQKYNIHGHVHHNSILGVDGKFDKRYINVSVEALEGYPIAYEDILSGKYWDIQRLTVDDRSFYEG